MPFIHEDKGCEVENLFGSLEECQDVCPTTFAPMIRLPRGGEVLAERGAASAILHFTLRANPPASLEWFHNGRPLSRFAQKYTMTEDYLQINKVRDYDAGTYVVKADNGIYWGDSDSSGDNLSLGQFHLIVYPLFPSVSIVAEKTLFGPEEDVVISCQVRAYPFPTIEWFKIKYDRGRRQELKIEEDERHRMESYPQGVVTTLQQLIISNGTHEDSGAYKCVAVSDSFQPVSDIEGISVDTGSESACYDSPSYSHCDKIVEHKYCGNKCNLIAFLKLIQV